MATLAEIRQQYPQYNNLSDGELAGRLYDKFYAGKIGREEFDQKLGITAPQDDQWERANFLPAAINKETGERALAVPGVIQGLFESGKGLMDRASQPDFDPSARENVAAALEIGAAATPMNPAVRAGARAIEGTALAKRAPGRAYSAPELKRTAAAQFAEFRRSPIKIDPRLTEGFSVGLEQSLIENGFVRPDAPSTYHILDAIRKAPQGGWMSAQGLHSLRKSLGRVAGNYRNPSDQAAASRAIQALDEFFAKLPDEGFVAGTTPAQIAAARTAFANARGNYSAAKTSELLTGKLHDAELRAAAANSGKNIDNRIRQKIAGVVLNDTAKRGLKPQEVADLEKLVEGGAATNAARDVSNLMGGGGGLGQILTGGLTGLAVGAGAGAMPGLATGAGIALGGRALKGLENQLTKRRLRAVDESVRARAPLGRELEVVGNQPKIATAKGTLVGGLDDGRKRYSRRESIAQAERVLSSDVLEHVKRSPNTRWALNDWLRARHLGKNVDEATRALAASIAQEVNQPELSDRIALELAAASGPK